MTDVSRPRLAFLSALLLVTAACGGSGDGGAASAAATITISNFDFAPETLEVKVGDTITVDNRDSAEHTVTATDRSFDTGPFTGRATFTVTKAGRFEYACEVHPFMPRRLIRVAG